MKEALSQTTSLHSAYGWWSISLFDGGSGGYVFAVVPPHLGKKTIQRDNGPCILAFTRHTSI